MNPARSRECWPTSVAEPRPGRFDLGGLDLEAVAQQPPTVVIVEAADEVGRAHKSIKRMRDEGALVEVPILVAVTVARLPALDFSIGFDGFVLMPVVPAELYGRMRQLDWRTATFGSGRDAEDRRPCDRHPGLRQ